MLEREAAVHWNRIQSSCAMATHGKFLAFVVMSAMLTFIGGISGLPDSVRLTGGDQWSGRLEVKPTNGQLWGTVDRAFFETKDAVVACRSLGLPTNNTKVISVSAFGDVDSKTPRLLTGFACNGDETHLLNCTYRRVMVHDGQRDYNHDVAVSCDPNLKFGFPNIGNAGMYSGAVFINGTWRPICKLSDQAAFVFCKSIGQETYHAHSKDSRLMETQGRKLAHEQGVISHVACDERESNLLQCVNNHWGPFVCPDGLAFLSCDDTVPFRLIRGDGTFGQLEVFFHRKWGSVCNSCFGPKEARIACQSLGLPSDGATLLGEEDLGDELPHDKSVIIMTNTRCNGDERSLMDCNPTMYKAHSCTSGRRVYLRCSSGSKGIKTKLDGSSAMAGRVLIQYNGEWGGICTSQAYDNSFTDLDAKVVCRSSDLPTNFARRLEARTSHSNKVWLSEIKCKGDEDNLFECCHSGVFGHTCSQGGGISVSCAEPIIQDEGTDHRQGVIVASISVVIVLVIIIIVGIIYYCVHKRKRIREERSAGDDNRVQYDCNRETLHVEIQRAPGRGEVRQNGTGDEPPKYEDIFPEAGAI